MSKKRKRIDIHPDQLAFDFDRTLDTYQKAKEEILEACHEPRPAKSMDNEAEACIEIAAAIKRAIRHSNLSREQVVDGINAYFGRAPKNDGKKPLTIHMLNNYLSKPVQYPIPTYYIYAIQHVTGSLAPARALVEPLDARVITGVEVRQMALGKLDETIQEMQRLKRELRGGKHG